MAENPAISWTLAAYGHAFATAMDDLHWKLAIREMLRRRPLVGWNPSLERVTNGVRHDARPAVRA